MIDIIINAIMLTGIILFSVPVLFFAVLTVVHLCYGAYTLTIDK